MSKRKSSYPRPALGELIDYEGTDHYVRREYVVAVRENDRQLVIETVVTTECLGTPPPGYPALQTWSRTKTLQKFLCVNGPFAGRRLLEAEAKNYIVYNRGRSGRLGRHPSAVLVLKSSLV